MVASKRGVTHSCACTPFQSPSLRGSGRFISTPGSRPPTPARFNPLHCGAVVASYRLFSGKPCHPSVSIPFIAGQWSLLFFFIYYLTHYPRGFQSPSLRGSGRFISSPWAWGFVLTFQSPSLRGSGRFIPPNITSTTNIVTFQSPSLRGSGRFALMWECLHNFGVLFQSPSLRGSGRFRSLA